MALLSSYTANQQVRNLATHDQRVTFHDCHRSSGIRLMRLVFDLSITKWLANKLKQSFPRWRSSSYLQITQSANGTFLRPPGYSSFCVITMGRSLYGYLESQYYCSISRLEMSLKHSHTWLNFPGLRRVESCDVLRWEISREQIEIKASLQHTLTAEWSKPVQMRDAQKTKW